MVGLDTQREVLAGLGSGQLGAIGVLEADGDHRVAFGLDCSDGQLAEAGPGRRRAGCCQAGVAVAGLIEQGAKRALPALAESGNSERPQELLPRMPGEVEERVDFHDRHLFRPGGDLDDLVPCLHLALFDHPEVEAGPAVGDEQGGNPRVVHPNPDPEARHSRLGDFEDGGADFVAIAYADLVIAQALDREVLAELSVDEVVSAELAFPVAIRLDLVDEDCPVLAAVGFPIRLVVSVDVDLAHHPRTFDRAASRRRCEPSFLATRPREAGRR